MKKITILTLTILLINPFILNQICFSEADFKDTSSEVKKTIKHFEDRESLKEFIGKYGEEYFRPTSTVTREDLIMALREYDEIVKTLLEYRRMLSRKVKELNREVIKLKNTYRKTDSSDIDEDMVKKVIDETQKAIPVLIENSPMPKKIEEEFISMREEISILQKPSIKATNAMIKKAIRESYPQIEEEAETQKEIENKISLLQNKLDLLIRQYNRAPKTSTDSPRDRDIRKKVARLEKSIRALESKVTFSKKATGSIAAESYEQEKIENEIAQLKREIRKWAKLYQNLPAKNETNRKSSKPDKEIIKKIKKLERSVKGLESKIASSNRKAAKINISGSSQDESNKNSTLTKVSLGISLLALVFMAR